jgi:hypothetical protein
MTVNINVDGINKDFPVSGVDNSSQGFRDNFNVIRTNFAVTKNELEDLKDNTARTDGDNSFLNNKITQAVFSNTMLETIVVGGSGTDVSNDPVDIKWSEGPVHVINVDTLDDEDFQVAPLTPLTVNLSEWTAIDKLYASVLIIIKRNGDGPREINLNITGTVLKSFTETIEAKTNTDVILEAFTYDAGQTVYLRKIGEFE